ncbi:Sodium/solute symporter superfamily [Sesbania bispinosa]|nr:Sodium/solute symporter superfamily [Sesbania bispinosa]
MLVPYANSGGKPLLSVLNFFGTHPIVGAFVYGLILPNGKFADMVMEMSDDFVTGVVCPIYFAGFGMRFNVGLITEQPNSHLMMFIVLLLSIPKVLSFNSHFFFGMPARDGVAIGLLLNTKGIMAVILLTIAWDKRMLDPLSFTVMMTAFLFMTVMVSPLINAIYKPKFRFMQSQLRTVQKLRFDAELRIVACVHNTHQATSIARVLQAMNATRISPLHEYNAVRFDTSSAVSSYATIHEDIYNVAEEKRASLILLHFHKELTSEGALEITNNAHIDINRHVLQKAPCSVGIFVDRGVGSWLETKLNIIMLFIGGPDDREALSIAWRMAGHSGTKLHVVRIHLLGEVMEENEDEIEDNYVNNNDSIVYSEKEVRTNTGEDIPLLLNEIDKPGYDLYIVGQGSGSKSPIFSRLLEWCDNPELGVIGDIVASTSFGTQSSLLVVQQYMPGRKLKFKRPKQSSHKKGDHDL